MEIEYIMAAFHIIVDILPESARFRRRSMENVHRSAEQRPVARLPDSAGWTAQEQAARGRKTAQKTSLPVGAGTHFLDEQLTA